VERRDDELIELIEPDPAAWAQDGDAAGTRRRDDRMVVDDGDEASRPRRPRWVVPTFAALLLVAGGAIVVSAKGSDEASSPVPTTRPDSTGSATTVPGDLGQVTLPTLVPPDAFPPLLPNPDVSIGPLELAEPAPKYVVTVPPQFNVATAYESETAQFGFDGFEGQLWADNEATAQTGRWFTLVRVPDGATGAFNSPDSYRRSVGNVAVAIAPPTATRPTNLLTIAANGDLGFIEAFGMSADELDTLVESVAVSWDFATSAFATQFRLVLEGPTRAPADITFSSSRVLTMVGPNPADSSSIGPAVIELSVDRIDATNRRLEAFVLTDIRRLAIGDDTAAVAGNLAASPGTSAVIWVDRDGWEVTLTGALAVEQMIDLARTARVDDVLWDIFRRAPSPRSPVNLETAEQVPVATITAQALAWTIGVTTARDTVAGRIWLSWWASTRGMSTGGLYIDAGAPTVSTLVYEGATFVYASAPVGSGAATLRLEMAGMGPRDVPMTATTTEFVDLLTGVTAFEEVASFTASIFDASGNVLATFPAATP
jgi:hypothetical protein